MSAAREPAIPTRSMSAQSPGATARVAGARRAQPNGWWGMALFLCAEATLFGTLLATYFYLDFNSRTWPQAGIKPPSVVLPLIATGALVCTSIPMFFAVRAGRAGNAPAAGGLVAVAMVVQSCYLAAQILLFKHDLNQFSPQDTAYGSIYFTMLAAHHAHVLLGLLLDGWVLLKVWGGRLNNYRLIGLRATALYWHVVNALAVFVVLTQLSPSL
jgi:heme/copper-type cytochrome/quinol oxidase subunit 3